MSEELREKSCTDLEWSLYKQVVELQSKLKESDQQNKRLSDEKVAEIIKEYAFGRTKGKYVMMKWINIAKEINESLNK